MHAKEFLHLVKVQLRNSGPLAFSISDRLRAEALESAEMLKPYNVGLLEVVQEYVARQEARDRSVFVKEAIGHFLAARSLDGLRPRYFKDLRVRLTRFEKDFGRTTVADITAAEVAEWLRNLKAAPRTRNSFRLRLSAFFGYALEQGWTQANPVKQIKPAITDEPIIGVLKPEEFARLLEQSSPETLPFWVFGGFCGLRTAELAALTWEDVYFDSHLVEVKAAKAKKRRRRLIPLRANVLQWLKPYQDATGKVCPVNLRTRLEADRRAAGLAEWPPNALRHSFGSYALARFQNQEQTALEMGHRNSDVLFEHYRELVRPKEADKWWDLVPSLNREIASLATA